MSHHHERNTCPTCNAVTTCRCMASKINTNNVCASCQSKEAVNEDAVAGSIGAGSIATFNGSLFGGSFPKSQRRKVAGIQVIRYKNHMAPKVKKPKKIVSEGAMSSFKLFIAEMSQEDSEFDSADVISKLSRNADMADKLDGDELAVFGLEDKDGKITKVYVPAEQGKEFEQALGDALRSSKENGQTEIAAMLFELKNKFKIVDVKWPTVQQDEEQTSAPTDPNAPAVDPNAAPVDPNAPATDPNATPADPNAPAVDPMAAGPAAPGADVIPTEDPTSMIAQILDMLKADAEARKADAAAKTAEANAKEAESAAKITAIKMQGEEGVLDAEAYFKARKEEKKEADRIKMMAKFRQETQMNTSQDSTSPVAPQTPAAPQGDESEEEEQQMSTIRKQLLSILNRGR